MRVPLPSPPARVWIAAVVLVAVSGSLHAQRPPSGAGGMTFTDATADSGIRYRNVCGDPPGKKGFLSEGMGAGAGWLDYDGDGNLDLYLANGSAYDRKPGEGESNKLYRGDGKGRFTDVTERAGVGHRGWGYGVAIGDIENDGDPDIYVTNFGPNVLYRNNGDGTFTDVTERAGVGNALYSSSAAFLDMDLDGDLDLYVGNYMDSDPSRVPRRGAEEARTSFCIYKGIPVFCGPLGQVPLQDALYRNDGEGRFTDVTRESGVFLEKPRYALGVVVADYDNDGKQDIYVANDSVQNTLWRNQGDGRFVDVGVGTLCALNADGRAQAGMGTAFGDYNGDGWIDLIVTNFAHDLNTLYRNVDGKFFIDDTNLAGLGVTYLQLSWGTGFYDFDHDADLDLFIANGHVYPTVDDYDLGTHFRQTNHLFRNDGGRFNQVAETSGPGLAVKRSFRGVAFGDYDDDGDVDLFVTTLDDDGVLLRNDTSSGGHSLQLRLVGSKSNRDAVGARVTVVAGGRRLHGQRTSGGSFQSSPDPRLHFGLGAATAAERIEIRWPGGATEILRDVKADRTITVREGSGIVE
jgi:hypothetical protein